MGTLLSLSRSASETCSWIAIICTVAFGTLFLISWCVEEYAGSDKWKRRRKVLLGLAIIGALGEMAGTITEFALSQHIQSIDDTTIHHLSITISPRLLNPDEQQEVLSKIRSFDGETIGIFTYDSASDAHILLTTLVPVFRAAHWKPDWGPVHFEDRQYPIHGLVIELGPNVAQHDKDAAHVLCAALQPYLDTTCTGAEYSEDIPRSGWSFMVKPSIYLTIAN
jgi:hypothetical protein